MATSSLIDRLLSLGRSEHDDLSVGDEAAEEINRLRAENRRLREDAVFAASVKKERDRLRAELAAERDKREKEKQIEFSDPRSEMVRQLAVAMGEDYARPQSPKQVWQELLVKAKRWKAMRKTLENIVLDGVYPNGWIMEEEIQEFFSDLLKRSR